jgi:hypothetical protein
VHRAFFPASAAAAFSFLPHEQWNLILSAIARFPLRKSTPALKFVPPRQNIVLWPMCLKVATNRQFLRLANLFDVLDQFARQHRG